MQPRLDTRYKADAYTFDDIRSGDFFFICCDGVLEQLSNEDLCAILADRSLDDSGKLGAIKAICNGKTRDNYSCWLVPIDKVEISGEMGAEPFVLQADMEHSDGATSLPACENQPPASSSHRFSIPSRFLPTNLKLWFDLTMLALALVLVGIFSIRAYQQKPKEEPVKTENQAIMPPPLPHSPPCHPNDMD